MSLRKPKGTDFLRQLHEYTFVKRAMGFIKEKNLTLKETGLFIGLY